MHEVPRHTGQKRLDRYLGSVFPHVSFADWQKWLRKGQIRVNGKRAKGSTPVTDGDAIRLPPFVNSVTQKPTEISENAREKNREQLLAMTLYEDDTVLILNKPQGLAVQGGSGQTRHVDGMLKAAYAVGAPRLVHRLDKDTSGVLLLAKTPMAATALGAQFRDHAVTKVYWACAVGVPSPAQGIVDAPLHKAGVQGDESVRYSEAGKPAITRYRVQATSPDGQYSWLELKPQTGRMHQLRVHCALLHTPIYGDGKYGEAKRGVALHLHAQTLTFQHPVSHVWQTITAPLPAAMRATWGLHGWDERAIVNP